MNRDDLLHGWFGKDVDGWEPQSYYKRINSNRITNGTMHDEWLIVMNTLVPGWRDDPELHSLRSVRLASFEENQMCICGKKHIRDICIYTHPTLLGRGLQIGNVCLDKIDPTLQKIASNKIRILKIKQKAIEELKKTHRPCYDCKEYNIAIHSEAWRIRCFPCWLKKKMKIAI